MEETFRIQKTIQPDTHDRCHCRSLERVDSRKEDGENLGAWYAGIIAFLQVLVQVRGGDISRHMSLYVKSVRPWSDHKDLLAEAPCKGERLLATVFTMLPPTNALIS